MKKLLLVSVLQIFTAFSFCAELSADSIKPTALEQNTDEAALQAKVESFFSCYKRKDLDGLFALWSKQSPDAANLRKGLENAFGSVDEIELLKLSIRKLTVSGNEAIVRVTVETRAMDLKTKAPSGLFGEAKRTLRFHKEDGQWMVWSYATDEKDLAIVLMDTDSDAERQAILAAEPGLITPLLVELRRRTFVYDQRGDAEKYIAAVKFTLAVAERFNDKALTVAVLRVLAGAYYRKLAYPQALEVIEKALPLAATSAVPEMAMLLNIKGNIHTSLGEYQVATEAFTQGLAIAEAQKNKGIEALLLVSFGVLQDRRGNYSQALAAYQRGLRLAEELNERDLAAAFIGNLGTTCMSLGEYLQALDYYSRTLTYARQNHNKRTELIALINVGLTHLALGDFEKSLAYEYQGLKIAEEIKDEKLIALTYQNIGRSYQQQGNVLQSQEFFQKSLTVSEKAKDPDLQMRLLINLANTHYQMGNLNTALGLLQDALAIGKQTDSTYSLVSAMYAMGSIYLKQERPEQAAEWLQRGKQIAETSGMRDFIAEAFYHLGQASYAQKQYKQAVSFAEQAAIQSEALRVPMLAESAHTLAGQAYLAQQMIEPAERHFSAALELTEQSRLLVAGEQNQFQFFASKLAPYQEMLKLKIGQGRQAEALGYAQRAKARTLLDALKGRSSESDKIISDTERQQDARLRQAMAELNLRLKRSSENAKADPAQIAELQSQLQKARLDYEAFRDKLYAQNPRLRVQSGNMQPLTPEQIASLLPDQQTAILEFVTTEQEVYLFVITRDGAKPTITAYPLKTSTQDLSSRVKLLEQRLANQDVRFRAPSQELFKLLIEPAHENIKTKKRLILIPDGVLWELPFQALLSSQSRYLLEDYSISYAPSLPALKEMAKPATHQRASNSLLAFGPPTSSAQTKPEPSNSTMANENAPLPEAENQVKQLQKLYGAKAYLGETADESRFKSEAAGYRVLHFATHGKTNVSNPLYSALHLAPTQKEDGRLEAWEVMTMDLQADLAVLAACETGKGKVSAGEGMIGLSWAFLAAGCPTTIASQWPVESSSTTEMMLEFYRQLNASKSTFSAPESLRLAALKLMRSPQFKHPFFWAPFIVVGAQ